MARVTITVPDELMVRARAAKVNISRTARIALPAELDRASSEVERDRQQAAEAEERLRHLDRYLDALDTHPDETPPGSHRDARLQCGRSVF